MALTTEDRDSINDALDAFAEKPVKEIPEDLEKLLNSIAVTGRATYPWGKVKLLLVQKLENVIEEYMAENPDESVPLLPNVENVSFADMKQRLLTNIGRFNDAPFTIQRICELLVSPRKYYMQRDKFMRGIEKNILIVTTVTPTGKRITSLFDGAKSTPMVNGILSESNIPNASSSEDNATEVTEEPSAKRIKLEELPEQGKEVNSTPSTSSEDRLPLPLEKEGSSEDGASDSSSSSTNGYSSDSQSSSEAMEAQGSSERLKDQSSSEEMEAQTLPETTVSPEPSQGLPSEGTDQEVKMEDSSSEEMEVQSSGQVAETHPEGGEETSNASDADDRKEENDSGK